MNRRIGITQRVSTRFHGAAHDCLDQAWSDLLLAMDYVPLPLPNLAGEEALIASYLSGLDLSAVILSGGNDIAGLSDDVAGSEVSPRRDAFEKQAILWARHNEVPILAVCRGMQYLNVVLGGQLKPIQGHAGTRHLLSTVEQNAGGCFAHLPDRFEVNSFHNFAMDEAGLAAGLLPVALDANGNVEAYVHSHDRIAGMMWHLERTTPHSELDMKTVRALIDRA